MQINFLYAHAPLYRGCLNENIDIRGVLKYTQQNALIQNDFKSLRFSDILDYKYKDHAKGSRGTRGIQ